MAGMFKELSRLFATPARIKILKYFILQPDLRATGVTVASTVGISKRIAEDELKGMVRAGILSSRKQGKTIVYALTRSNGFEDALRRFLDETTLPEDFRIIEMLRGVRGLTLVVATGTLASEPRGSVDLLIVTRKPKDSRIAKSVRRLESLVALPIRYAVLETKDYEDRLESYDRLLRDVFEFNHRIIFGKK
jgi:hypothetical protein